MPKLVAKKLGRSLMCLGLGAWASALGCSAAPDSEAVGEQQQKVWDYDENAGIFQPAAAGANLRENVVVSLWKPGKWSVAGATNTGDGCSGILISPRLVLTSSSCTRRLNTTSFDVYVGPRTPAVAGQSTKFEAQLFKFLGDPSGEPSLKGSDVAMLTLKTPVLEQAIVHRPPLALPAPLAAKDANGWAPYGIGMSGWSPFTMVAGLNVAEAQTTRQTISKNVIGDDEIRLNRQSVGTRALWAATTIKPVSNLPKIGLAPGDNGGPLFVKGPNDRLDVVGVASIIGAAADSMIAPIYAWNLVPAQLQTDCVTPAGAPVSPSVAPFQCDFWTDVTAASTRTWVTHTATLSTTERWRLSHPRRGEGQAGLPWLGEVDYGGACQSATDADCDHVYTVNSDNSSRDNCPATYNPDQEDTKDVGIGDACFPSCMAQACTAGNSCAVLDARGPACVAIAAVKSPDANYASSTCSQHYTALLDQSHVAAGGSTLVAARWGDDVLTSATCADARVELVVFKQKGGGPLTTTAHKYHGELTTTSTGITRCTLTLDTGFVAPDPVTASETVKLAGSAWSVAGGVTVFKKVELTARSGPPCMWQKQ